jgi:hypothetical protein
MFHPWHQYLKIIGIGQAAIGGNCHFTNIFSGTTKIDLCHRAVTHILVIGAFASAITAID